MNPSSLPDMALPIASPSAHDMELVATVPSDGRSSLTRSDWQQQLAQAIRDPAELLELLELPDSLLELARAAAKLFPLLVPHDYVRRMERGNPRDPLLLQVLPLESEFETVPGFVIDPVDDQSARRVPGLLQKYQGRVLAIATGLCAIHCRYCFRRHYPYHDEPRGQADWQPTFTAIQQDPTVREVILSGGDPLTLGDRRLGEWVERLAGIPHVQRLRIHTRLPVVLPARVTEELLALLTSSRLTPIVVIHANHPAEIVGHCAAAIRRLVRAGIVVLNQSVLLRGINDSAEVLAELSERLIDLGAMPYYLHQLDRVAGAAHFEVREAEGLDLIAQMRQQLPGYGVPQFVREIAGAAHKVPIE